MPSIDIPADKMFNYRQAKYRNMAIARCGAKMLVVMNLHGIERDVVPYLHKWGTVAIRADVYRARSLDDDNLIASVNKLLIDPMVRAGYLVSDSRKRVRLSCFWHPTNAPHVILTFNEWRGEDE